jgi:hypothetical protein
MNIALTIEQVKMMSKAGFHKEALDECDKAIEYLVKAENEGKSSVVTYLPIFGEPIMTRYGVSKRVNGYDKKESKNIEFWKDRFFDLILLFTQRYNRKMGIKPKKVKPFKKGSVDRVYASNASFGSAGPSYRNSLD